MAHRSDSHPDIPKPKRPLPPPLRVVIAEDHVMMRDCLAALVTKRLGGEVVGTTGRGDEAIQLCAQHHPNVLVLDLHFPAGPDGVEVAEAVVRQVPPPRVLVFSVHADPYSLWRLDRAHVPGYVDKTEEDADGFITALCIVATGGRYYSPAFIDARWKRQNDPMSFEKLLTDRETEVVGLAGNGLGADEISRALGIARATAKRHLHGGYSKIRARSPLELMASAIRLGIARVFRQRANGGAAADRGVSTGIADRESA